MKKKKIAPLFSELKIITKMKEKKSNNKFTNGNNILLTSEILISDSEL
jgi:hypothetical protein